MSHANIHERIETLRALVPNWDSYGAPVISERAIQLATDIADSIDNEGVIATATVWPRSDGGIEIEWEPCAGCRLTVEIDP